MKEQDIAVCKFGNTEYDSRLFDRIYRSYGTEDGGTILSAYWIDELKSFKTNVPYYIIQQLLSERQIGALCSNYDWKEFDIKSEIKEEFNMEAWLKTNPQMYTVPSNKWCLEIASKVTYYSIEDLIDKAEKIKEYCKQPL